MFRIYDTTLGFRNIRVWRFLWHAAGAGEEQELGILVLVDLDLDLDSSSWISKILFLDQGTPLLRSGRAYPQMFSSFLCCRNFPCEKMIHLFSVFITPHCLESFVFLWEFRHFHYEWPLYWTTYTIFRFYSWTFRSIYYLINNKHVFKAKRFKVRERESYKWWFHSRCLSALEQYSVLIRWINFAAVFHFWIHLWIHVFISLKYCGFAEQFPEAEWIWMDQKSRIWNQL